MSEVLRHTPSPIVFTIDPRGLAQYSPALSL